MYIFFYFQTLSISLGSNISVASLQNPVLIQYSNQNYPRGRVVDNNNDLLVSSGVARNFKRGE